MSDFADLHPALGQALANRGYDTLTSVQLAVSKKELAGRDLLVSAQTGSGKTVAFGLAMGPILLGEDLQFKTPREPLALVIAPTRELALQVKTELTWLYADTRGKLGSCVGGMDMRRERRDLAEGRHIVVGTPGRLRDHIERGSLDLSHVRVVVIDEADEMLDLGFREDLEFILSAAPGDRHTFLFSATVPPAIEKLAETYQYNAERITTREERNQHADIDYHAHLVATRDKEKSVINVLRYHEAASSMIFCGTREMVRHLSARLSNRGFAVVALSGEMNQTDRSQALQAMRDGRARICVATDVAARGLDLPHLDLVIHADIPNNSEALLHRSGRTGRAGRKGTCVIIVPVNKRLTVNRLLKQAHIRVKWEPTPSLDGIIKKDQERIFAHPSLKKELSEEALLSAQNLLALYGPEQVAAAFIDSLEALYPAPEEIVEPDLSAPSPEKRKNARERSSFEGGVWFRLDTGRRNRAEPRWILPMICRIGGFAKNKVGFIRILEKESVFELAPDAASRFETITEVEGTGNHPLQMIKLSEPPDLTKDRAWKGNRRSFGDKKGRSNNGQGGRKKRK